MHPRTRGLTTVFKREWDAEFLEDEASEVQLSLGLLLVLAMSLSLPAGAQQSQQPEALDSAPRHG